MSDGSCHIDKRPQVTVTRDKRGFVSWSARGEAGSDFDSVLEATVDAAKTLGVTELTRVVVVE